MPVIFDKLRCRPKFIQQSALDFGGYYFDIINSRDGYIPQYALTRTVYLDPITGMLEYKLPSGGPPAGTPTFDSTLITWDSTLFTFDNTNP